MLVTHWIERCSCSLQADASALTSNYAMMDVVEKMRTPLAAQRVAA